MTQVIEYTVTRPIQNGENAPANGTIECRPSLRRYVDHAVVLPARFTARLVDGTATLDLAEPDGTTWCWEITERCDRGVKRYVLFTEVGGTIYADDLVDVDPGSFDPVAPPSPAWVSTAADLQDQIDQIEVGEASDEAVADRVTNGTETPVAVDARIDDKIAGLAEVAMSGAYSDLSGAPMLGTAAAADTADFATAAQGTLADNAVPSTRTVAGKPLSANVTLAKGDVGLGSVDNTADSAKPVSTVQAAAIGQRALDPMRFDSTRLRAFRAALGRRDCDILTVGASWAAGSGAGTPPAGRWTELFLAGLRSRYGVTGGLGYRESYSTTTGWVSPFTIAGGSPVTQFTLGLGRKVVRLGAGGTITFTSPGTSVDVLYGKGTGGGGFTWAVNGGATTAVSTTAATTSDDRVHIPTSSGDTITLTVTSNYLYFEGVMFYDGDETTGIRFWNGATSGFRTADFVDAAAVSYGAWGIVDPDLVIVGDTVANDYGGGTVATPLSVTASKAALVSLVAAIRAKCTRPPSVILTMLPQINTAATPLAPWADFRAMVQQFAEEDGQITVVDLAPIFGSMVGTDTYGITAGDQAHPNKAGYQAIADLIFNTAVSA